jgi:U3 small nucleolar RNA-associated protein 19
MEPVAKKRKRSRDDAVDDEILELELRASESPKYFNNISKLLDVAFPLDQDPQPLAILALSRVFIRLSADGWFRPPKSKSDQTIVVRQWLADRLNQFTHSLLSQPNGAPGASLSITVLMRLVQQLVSSGSESWTDGLFAKLVKSLTESGAEEPHSIFLRDYFVKYADVRFYTIDILR